MIVPIIGLRDFWGEARCWISVLVLGAAQVPLVLEVRPFLEQFKFPLLLTFGILDCALVIAVLSWACSSQLQRERN